MANGVKRVEMMAEHAKAKRYYAEILDKFDHPEALRALTAIGGILRITVSSLWDGSNGLNDQRQEQARIDAQVMVDLGMAIDEHVKSHRH